MPTYKHKTYTDLFIARGKEEDWMFTTHEFQYDLKPRHKLCSQINPDSYQAQRFDDELCSRILTAVYSKERNKRCLNLAVGNAFTACRCLVPIFNEVYVQTPYELEARNFEKYHYLMKG